VGSRRTSIFNLDSSDSLTRKGRKELELEEENWARLTEGVRRVLRDV
jgi:hypothetical protein